MKTILAGQFMRWCNIEGAPMRNPNFAVGVALASDAPPSRFLSEAATVALSCIPLLKIGNNKALAYMRIIKMVLGLNTIADDLPADLVKEAAENGLVHYGTELSPYAQSLLDCEAMQEIFNFSGDRDFYLIRHSGIVDVEVLKSFINLVCHCYVMEGRLAHEYALADETHKPKIRAQMAEYNAQGQGIYLSLFVHLLNPNPDLVTFVAQGGLLDYEQLKGFYPAQTAIGESWQYAFMMQETLNRLYREGLTGRIEPDYVIAQLEGQERGAEILAELRAVIAAEAQSSKLVPLDALPELSRIALLDALKSTAEKAREKLKTVDGMRNQIYSALINLPLTAGKISGVGDEAASYRLQVEQRNLSTPEAVLRAIVAACERQASMNVAST